MWNSLTLFQVFQTKAVSKLFILKYTTAWDCTYPDFTALSLESMAAAFRRPSLKLGDTLDGSGPSCPTITLGWCCREMLLVAETWLRSRDSDLLARYRWPVTPDDAWCCAPFLVPPLPELSHHNVVTLHERKAITCIQNNNSTIHRQEAITDNFISPWR